MNLWKKACRGKKLKKKTGSHNNTLVAAMCPHLPRINRNLYTLILKT